NGHSLGDTNDALGRLGRRNFGLLQLLARQRATLLGDAQATELTLGREVRRTLLDDAFLLDGPCARFGGRLARRRDHPRVGGRRGSRRRGTRIRAWTRRRPRPARWR